MDGDGCIILTLLLIDDYREILDLVFELGEGC